MTLYFITGNKNKFEEVKSILNELKEIKQIQINLQEIQETDSKKIIEYKLKEALKHKEQEFIVEDTSLYLECLNGLPGPLIKWFLEKIGNKGLYEITKKFKNSRAKAKTIIGYAKNPREIYYFEGSVKGNIVSPKGDFNFGWDFIFKPHGFSKTFSEMNAEEKNQISMRRIAINNLKEFIKKTEKK